MVIEVDEVIASLLGVDKDAFINDKIIKASLQHGYKVITIAGKTYSVHRLVMEEKLGRPLTSEEVVHHIDGNRANNKEENLQLFTTNAKHMKHHHSELEDETLRIIEDTYGG